MDIENIAVNNSPYHDSWPCSCTQFTRVWMRQLQRMQAPNWNIQSHSQPRRPPPRFARKENTLVQFQTMPWLRQSAFETLSPLTEPPSVDFGVRKKVQAEYVITSTQRKHYNLLHLRTPVCRDTNSMIEKQRQYTRTPLSVHVNLKHQSFVACSFLFEHSAKPGTVARVKPQTNLRQR